MAIKIEGEYQKQVDLTANLDQVYTYFSNLELSIPENFKGLEIFENLGDGVYFWKFKTLEYGGRKIPLEFRTRFEMEMPHRIVATLAETNSPQGLTALWNFQSAGVGHAQLEFKARIHAELDLPFFLKAVVSPIAEKEMVKFLDRYLENAIKKFT